MMKKVRWDFSGMKENIIPFEKDLAQQRQDERRERGVGNSGLQSPEARGLQWGHSNSSGLDQMREHSCSQLSHPLWSVRHSRKKLSRDKVEAGKKWEARWFMGPLSQK